jgi:hypothetical protein
MHVVGLVTRARTVKTRRARAHAGVLLLAVCAGVGLWSGKSSAQSELVLQKEGSKEYHRPACAVVKDGKGVTALTRAQAEARGLTAHKACDPAFAPAADPGPSKPAPVDVFVDGGRYYHRASCRKLAAKPKKVPLEDAGKKYWPCPACKPPIRARKGGPG